MLNSLENIMIGRYLHRDSLLHKMDSRLKFFLVVSLMVATSFFAPGYPFLLIAFVSFFIGMLSRISLAVLIKGIKPFLFLFTFIFLFHSFLTPGRPVSIFFLKSIGVTYEGLQHGIMIDLRLVILIYLSSILTLTTSPKKIIFAIEWFLSPLKLFGFQLENLSMIILISLKFIPILFNEISATASISQKKWLKSEKWNLRLRIKEIVLMISPIVINSFHRANKLAKDIDDHGFDAIEKL